MSRIDYFFNLSSPWAYVGLEPLADLAARHNAELVPHIIPLIEENGGIYSRNRPPARRAYWTTDLKRWAYQRGVALQFEGRVTLSDPMPAARQVVAAHLSGLDWLDLARTYHRAFWSEARNIGDTATRNSIAAAAGFDPTALETLAASDAVTQRLAESYALAERTGVFGVPSYLSGDVLFWGQDNLGFLDRHLSGERLLA